MGPHVGVDRWAAHPVANSLEKLSRERIQIASAVWGKKRVTLHLEPEIVVDTTMLSPELVNVLLPLPLIRPLSRCLGQGCVVVAVVVEHKAPKRAGAVPRNKALCSKLSVELAPGKQRARSTRHAIQDRTNVVRRSCKTKHIDIPGSARVAEHCMNEHTITCPVAIS